MQTVILIIHLMIAIALVVVVLMQKSEGGALGIGGGGGGFMSGRGVADALTSITAMLAAAFFVTSITLTILSGTAKKPTSITDGIKSSSPSNSGGLKLGDEKKSLMPPKPSTPAAPMTPPK